MIDLIRIATKQPKDPKEKYKLISIFTINLIRILSYNKLKVSGNRRISSEVCSEK
jgi:hypothetical protein